MKLNQEVRDQVWNQVWDQVKKLKEIDTRIKRLKKSLK